MIGAAEAKAQRLIAQAPKRLGWKEGDFKKKPKTDAGKLAVASRLRRKTTVTIKWLAARLSTGSPKTLNTTLHRWRKAHE